MYRFFIFLRAVSFFLKINRVVSMFARIKINLTRFAFVNCEFRNYRSFRLRNPVNRSHEFAYNLSTANNKTKLTDAQNTDKRHSTFIKSLFHFLLFVFKYLYKMFLREQERWLFSLKQSWNYSLNSKKLSTNGTHNV